MEESQVVSDNNNNASGEVAKQEQIKNPDAYELNNKRLLGEKKMLMEKLSELERKVQGFEQKDLEAKGDYDQLIQKLRDENDQRAKELETMRSTFGSTVIKEQFARLASSQGCQDPDAAMKLMDTDAWGAIQVDDNFRVNEDDVVREIGNLKNTRSYLFAKDVKIVDGYPNNTIPKDKSLKEMSTDEIDAMIKKLDNN